MHYSSQEPGVASKPLTWVQCLEDLVHFLLFSWAKRRELDEMWSSFNLNQFACVVPVLKEKAEPILWWSSPLDALFEVCHCCNAYHLTISVRVDFTTLSLINPRALTFSSSGKYGIKFCTDLITSNRQVAQLYFTKLCMSWSLLWLINNYHIFHINNCLIYFVSIILHH